MIGEMNSPPGTLFDKILGWKQALNSSCHSCCHSLNYNETFKHPKHRQDLSQLYPQLEDKENIYQKLILLGRFTEIDILVLFMGVLEVFPAQGDVSD
jgi:hypothetical protein